jgi:hypothetical protein
VPPTAALTVSTAEVDGLMLAGLTDAVRPLEGVVPNETVPVKPFRAVIVIVDVPLTPGVVLTMVGVATTLKSTTWNSIVLVVWLRVPSVPVTVTV